MIRRRPLLLGGLAGAVSMPATTARAQTRGGLASIPLRLGVDDALVASRLAPRLQHAFGVDTGLAATLVAGPATTVLAALERGELDAAAANAPELAEHLEQQGLAHELRAVALSDWLLVGPKGKRASPDPAGVQGSPDMATALGQLRDAALSQPGTISFLSANDGSGSHLAEQALWRAARIAPAAPWYLTADAGRALLAQAQARSAYAIVELGVWLAQGGAPLARLVDAGKALPERVQVLRAFRSSHPTAHLLVGWLSGPKGRAIVAAHPGYRAPPG